MDGFVLDLFFGSAHQIANSGFCILSPIGLDVGDFHGEEFSVEAVEERHEEILFALDPEVAVSIVESPGIGASLSKHEEIFSTGDKTHGDESSEEDKGMSTGHAEMFIVRTDLFRTAEFGFGACSVGDSEKDGLEAFVERVDIGSLGGFFDGFCLFGSISYSFFESLDIGFVSLREYFEGFSCELFR